MSVTQEFSVQNLDENSTDRFSVSHAGFDYEFGRWHSKTFVLPKFGNDYVLLTPKDILSKDDTWINKTDFVREYNDIPTAIPNEELRDRVDAYFQSVLPSNPSAKEAAHAVQRTALKFPELIDYYIRLKEDRGSEAELRIMRRFARPLRCLLSKHASWCAFCRREAIFTRNH